VPPALPRSALLHAATFGRFGALSLLLASCWLTGCSESQEAKQVELPVVTDGEGLMPVTTDLGYEVELVSARLAADNLQFTIAGEAHTSFWRQVSDALVPVAHAHPGHYQGGEVTGELPGHFILRFARGEAQAVGTATLLIGTYHAVNLTLAHASASDVEEEGDPLLGHSAVLTGSATKDGVTIDFEVLIDSPAARDLVGIPFDAEITELGKPTLALRLSTRDELEDDTLFDSLDFAALDRDADGRVLIEPTAADAADIAAYNTIRRVFQTHDHFSLHALR
jgi:hypothetical protein